MDRQTENQLCQAENRIHQDPRHIIAQYRLVSQTFLLHFIGTAFPHKYINNRLLSSRCFSPAAGVMLRISQSQPECNFCLFHLRSSLSLFLSSQRIA